MSKRTKIGLIIVLGLLVILLVWVFLLWPEKQPASVPADPGNAPPAPSAATEPTPLQAKQQETRVQTASLQTVAKVFAERYGSYSNEAAFGNLKDVLPFMTEAFAARTQAFIASSEPPEGMYGVTTRVISLAVDALDEAAGTATLSVSTQREEMVGSVTNILVTYQTLELDMAREGGTWKVADAAWR